MRFTCFKEIFNIITKIMTGSSVSKKHKKLPNRNKAHAILVF